MVEGTLADWVNDHVEDLMAELALADDLVAPAAEEGGAYGDNDDTDADSSASR